MSDVVCHAEPTNELRFVLRQTPTGPQPFDVRYERILQQLWSIKTYQARVYMGSSYEWRDVPVMKEERTNSEEANKG